MGIATKNRASGEAVSSPVQAVEQSPGRVTLAKVNAALTASGFEEQLQRGAGYFYFAGGHRRVMAAHKCDGVVAGRPQRRGLGGRSSRLQRGMG